MTLTEISQRIDAMALDLKSRGGPGCMVTLQLTGGLRPNVYVGWDNQRSYMNFPGPVDEIIPAAERWIAGFEARAVA